MKIKHFSTLIVVIIMFAINATTSFSQDKDWIVIASKTVAYKVETDKVIPMGQKQNVSKIKLTCTQGTLKIKRVSVKMSDGTKKDFKPKGTGVLSKGMSTLSWTLPGKKDAKLKEIELEYDSVGTYVITKKAKVEILGKKRTK